MSKELSKSIDPLAIITIIATFSYFIGWAYTWGYFARLGIQYQSLNLPASFYLSKAFWCFLAISLIVIPLSYSIKKDFKEFQKRVQSTFTIFMILFSFMILFLLISFCSSLFVGDYHAKSLVEGEIGDLYMINFSWKENPPKEIEGKELMLIIHQESKYYVVNRQKPAPEYPEVYIIPDDQIKFAVMKKKSIFFIRYCRKSLLFVGF